MVKIVGIRFRNAGKLYFFDPAENWPTPGSYAVVETSRGIELGEVVTPVHEVEEERLTAPLKQIVRVATADDIRRDTANREAAKRAFAVCQQKIRDHGLEMKLIGAEYTFDNSKIMFYFTAGERVDFRSLVKDLGSTFHTRVELRQVGARDEAKMLGGLGPCGRPICCGTFLGDFQPVSIKMAKEQNLSMNPTKISGICGRLMCCLKYEEEYYSQTRKRMPRIGREIATPDGPGTVSDLNIIRETVRVRINKGDSFEQKDYTLEELRELNGWPDAQNPPVRAEGEAEKREPKEEPPKAGRPPRQKSREERPKREPRPAEQAERPAAEKKPEAPAPVPAAKPEPQEPPKKTAWKDALERAMKAAGQGAE